MVRHVSREDCGVNRVVPSNGPIPAVIQSESSGAKVKNGYCYLTMTAGPRSGTSFLLDQTDETQIGRGTDCDIILVDPLCSRVHAQLLQEDDGWWVRDAGSRNGTYLNGQKVERGRLTVGATFRVGSTEFLFNWSEQPPTMNTVTGGGTERIVKQQACDTSDTNLLTSSLKVQHLPDELMALYQLALKLLGTRDPDSVVGSTLEQLRQRTKARIAGFLWVNDDGQLTPKLVVPENAEGKVLLSQQLTDLVCRKSRAIWVANDARQATPSDYSDAICVPLIHQCNTLGAIHLYRDQGNFEQRHFDFSISLAGLLVIALVRAREQATLAAEHKRLVDSSGAADELVGECDSMLELKSAIKKIATATGCVLVRGESGAGKELVARALHKGSPRADRPLLSVNCAAIPPSLIESQLFGHAKGSFTGADSQHIGWFQQADSGTLFLDEVGELPLVAQAKLLRILEGHPFLPIGSTKEVNVDVRVIAATNRDLRHLVNEKKFREDLFYRLTVFEVEVPPLRNREGDIELLVNHFLEHFRQHHGRPELDLSEDARQKLLLYRWPGNVRQLRNVIDSAVVMADDQIEVEQLGLQDDVDSPTPDSLRIDHWEQKLIHEALKRTKGKVPEAAKLLGIGRATLYRKLDEYNIKR